MYFPMGSPMLGSKSAVPWTNRRNDFRQLLVKELPIYKNSGITNIAECGIVLYKSL